MSFYRIVINGEPEYHELPGGGTLPEGAIVVDRMPVPFEDFVAGQWVKDYKACADSKVTPEHIREAHALKYAEAVMVKAGVELTGGLLIPEAAVKGITLEALANEVIEHREEFIQKEIQRQIEQEGEE